MNKIKIKVDKILKRYYNCIMEKLMVNGGVENARTRKGLLPVVDEQTASNPNHSRGSDRPVDLAIMNGLPLNQPAAGNLGYGIINRRRVLGSQSGSAPNQRSMEFGRHQRYRPVERFNDGGYVNAPLN